MLSLHSKSSAVLSKQYRELDCSRFSKEERERESLRTSICLLPRSKCWEFFKECESLERTADDFLMGVEASRSVRQYLGVSIRLSLNQENVKYNLPLLGSNC